MANTSKPAFGNRSNIDAAKTSGAIDAYDVLYLGDTKEIGWIDKDGNTIISKNRTQEDIEVNGVTGLGVANGSTIAAGKSLDEIVKMLVQKAVPATYTAPTITIANNGGTAAGSVESGTTVTPNLRATFTQNDAGALTAIHIKKDGNAISNAVASPMTYSNGPIVIGDTTVTFSASASYEEGAVKNNNLGDPSPNGHIEAGTINTTSNFIYTGKRNAFYGTGVGSIPEITSNVVRGLSGKKLSPAQNTVLNISVAVGQQYIIFAYPATLRDVNQVMYVEANDGGMASSFTKSVVDVADARGGTEGLMSYKVYSYAMAVPAAAPMTFKVTI